MSNLQLIQKVTDPEVASFKGRPGQRLNVRVVDGAEGFRNAARSHGKNRRGSGRLGEGKETAEPVRVEARHVAGDNEAPFRAAQAKGCLDTAQWTAPRVEFRQAGDGDVRIAFRRADELDAAGTLADQPGYPFDKGAAMIAKQRLVLSHAGALTAGQNESSAQHETILAAARAFPNTALRQISLFLKPMGRYNQKNKLMVSCLTMMWGIGLAAPATAAEPAVRLATTIRADARTGRLVRGTVAVPPVAAAKAKTATSADLKQGIEQIIDDAAKAHEVDPLLVHSVIQVESNYNPFAISNKGAEGIMQLIPATARRFGVVNSFDAKENITAGVKYLKYLQETFKDDRLALAAYNAGEGAVQRYKDVPPYKETEVYVQKVGRKYVDARKKARPSAAVMPAAQQPQPEPLRGLEVATDSEGRVILRTR